MDEFYSDAAKAAIAEQLTTKILTSKTSNWCFEWVGNIKKYRHKGDIKATDPTTGFSLFLEVKDDSRIAETDNILCEYLKYFYQGGYKPGNMTYDYEYYCVISQGSRTIYVIDFSILKEIYKSGEHKTILHDNDITYSYLVPLSFIEEKGGLIKTIQY